MKPITAADLNNTQGMQDELVNVMEKMMSGEISAKCAGNHIDDIRSGGDGVLERVKKCGICGDVKSVSLFIRDRSRKDGLQSRCKACTNKYRANNKEKIAAYAKEYAANNKEKIAVRRKEYLANNKEKIAANQKEHRANNKEKISAYAKEYAANNKEKIAVCDKEYRANNKEKITVRRKEYNASRVATCSDGYIAQLISDGTTLSTSDIPPELIEAKRLQIKLKREIKDSKNEQH